MTCGNLFRLPRLTSHFSLCSGTAEASTALPSTFSGAVSPAVPIKHWSLLPAGAPAPPRVPAALVRSPEELSFAARSPHLGRSFHQLRGGLTA